MNRKKLLWFKRHKLLIGLLSLSPIIGFFVFLPATIIFTEIDCRQISAALGLEINQIVQAPQATLVAGESFCELDMGSITRKYAAPLTGEGVFDYYEQALKSLGWDFLEPEEITYAGVERRYCKGGLTASVLYYREGYEWNHHIQLTSGTVSDCEVRKGGGIFYLPLYVLCFILGSSVCWLVYAVIMYSVIWGKDAMTYLKILESVLRSKPRPVHVFDYRLETTFIIVVSSIGIEISLYGIAMYLWNFLRP